MPLTLPLSPTLPDDADDVTAADAEGVVDDRGL